ncbi:hypothetical protein P279_11675 [Rhodobacteraceae bacterium PD-2]|nr:hypothetical protein P279_11675 [Rhodobacteraceae bacterium PD-2]
MSVLCVPDQAGARSLLSVSIRLSRGVFMIWKFLILHLKLAMAFIITPLVLVLEIPLWIKLPLVAFIVLYMFFSYRRFLLKKDS